MSINPASPDEDPDAGQVIRLRNGRIIETVFFVDSLVTTLPRSSGIPFLVLRMVPCSGGCGAAPGLVAIPADTSALDSIPRPAAPYPGTVREARFGEDTEEAYRSRLFIGECLQDSTRELVWFARERDSTGAWVPSVLRLRVLADTLNWSEPPAPQPGLHAIVSRVKAGKCKEVPGLEQVES